MRIAYEDSDNMYSPLVRGIANGLANPSRNQTGLVNGCSTGNCSFPMQINGITHSTIGMCSQCIDIASELQATGIDGIDGTSNVMTLPNGLSWQSDIAINASGIGISFDSILSQVEAHGFAAIMPASILNWTVIAMSGPDRNSPLSTACSIYPCMKHYAGLVDRGEFNETLVSTVPAFPSGPDDDYLYAGINASCVINGSAYDLTRILPNQIRILQNGSVSLTFDKGNLTLPSQCINKIDILYGEELENYLSSILTRVGIRQSDAYPSLDT